MTSFKEVWSAAMEICGEGSAVLYDTWFSKLTDAVYKDGVVTLTVHSDFWRDVISGQFSDRIVGALNSVLGFAPEFRVVTSDAGSEDESEPVDVQYHPVSSFRSDMTFEQSCTFERFIVGKSNELAYAAAQRVADKPGSVYNPLFIYGHSGLGKTHLMLAIKNRLKQTRPDLKLVYITGEQFTNELIKHIAKKNTEAFHDKYRSVDVLMIDDVQFIAGKQQTQEEFFHTFNTLTQSGKQIVMTSDRPPRDMTQLTERLRGRFESGMLVDIQIPDKEMRYAILQLKFADVGIKEVNADVLQYLSDHLESNVRQLEGAVTKIAAICELNGSSPTVNDAVSVLDHIKDQRPSASDTAQSVIKTVSEIYGIEASDIVSQKRQGDIAEARQVAMYVIRKVSGMQLQDIGDLFGKTHSTVNYSIDQTERKIKTDFSLRSRVEDVIKTVKENY